MMIAELYRVDAMYAASDFSKYSVTRVNSDYRKFSEVFAELFPGYALGKDGLIFN